MPPRQEASTNPIPPEQIPDVLWAQLQPHIPSSWNKDSMSRLGVQQDYTNDVTGGRLLVQQLYSPMTPVPESEKPVLVTHVANWLRQIPSYKEYCMRWDDIHERTPDEIAITLAIIADSLPQARELDEIVNTMHGLAEENLQDRTVLERLIFLMGDAAGITHSERYRRSIRSIVTGEAL